MIKIWGVSANEHVARIGGLMSSIKSAVAKTSEFNIKSEDVQVFFPPDLALRSDEEIRIEYGTTSMVLVDDGWKRHVHKKVEDVLKIFFPKSNIGYIL